MVELCWWCRLRPAEGIDHLTPTHRGGSNTSDNLVPACTDCNSQKGGKTAEEYGAWLRLRALVMSTTCPKCGAGPGERCVSVREIEPRVLGALHPDRKAAA